MSDHEQMGEKAEAEANYMEEATDQLGEDIEAAKEGVDEAQQDALIPAPAEFDTDQSDEPEADYPAKR
jgi:hypothetical protein